MVLKWQRLFVCGFYLQTVKVDVAYTVPLVQAVGVSSSFVAHNTQGDAGKEDTHSADDFEYWNQDDFKSKARQLSENSCA